MVDGNDNDNDNGNTSPQWIAVIAKSLAILSLGQSDVAKSDLAAKGRFLEALGISRTDAAGLLGTSYGSLTQLMSVSAKGKKKGSNRGGKKKS